MLASSCVVVPRFLPRSIAAAFLALLSLITCRLWSAPTTSQPWALASADFDGDGKADLVVAGSGDRSVRILLSGGNTVELALDSTAVALAAGDVNGDGKPDLVVATGVYVEVFFSNGDGTFQDAIKYDAGDSPVSIAAGDLNGDGRADLIVLGAHTQHVLVLLSNADGTLQPPISYAVGGFPTALALGDFKGDSRLDLVVADAATNEVLLLLGNGDGRFEAGGRYSTGPLPRSLAVGDFNGDGIADVAVAGLGDGHVRLLLGTARGALEPGGSLEAGMGWTSIIAADLDGRGKVDLVWANANTGMLGKLRGRGDGSFTHTQQLAPRAAPPMGAAELGPAGPPFGVIDTPINGSTGQAGAINFTGWALSLSTVSKVALCREPVVGEGNVTDPRCLVSSSPTGLVYMANAVLVPGVRPDVALSHPGYPNNNWGWGAQILTNFLPGTSGLPLGNGTYKLHAIAADQSSLSTDLGSPVTISANNAASSLPFGTIDTPAQGQTISGTNFINFGWVLTPLPNIVPIDGSTIVIHIDGQVVGHPTYNQVRSDIATVFPGLRNTSNGNGGVGYFPIDTTTLSNGIHSIDWVATDSAGNAGGLGSRFFFVSNVALSLTGSPLSINVGATGILTLNLSAPAPSAGLTVNLSSSDTSKVTIPATVSFAAGATSVPVTVTGVAAGSATITASAAGLASATATVNVASVLINIPANATVALGQSATFTVMLSQPAPAGGVTIALISSDTSKVTLPASVFIAAGATTPITQPQVAGAGIGTATVTASAANFTSGSGAVTVSAPTLSFTGSPLTINAGSTGNLTLILGNGQAPASGLTISLTSSNTGVATVPASVTFAASATSVPVPVTVVAAGSATITASAAGILNATAMVNVTNLAISVPSSTTVPLGQSVAVAVTLAQAAPAGGVTITLISSDTSKVTVPASVFIAAGATTPATPPQVTGAGIGSASITASAVGYTSGGWTVTVSAPTMSFTGSPLTINAGASGNVTLNLTNGRAPAGGLTVSLISSNGAASVPAIVTFTAGATSVPVTVTGVSAGSSVITATAPGVSNASANVTINPPGAFGLSCNNITVGKDLEAACTVQIGGPAQAGGQPVTLTSNNSSLLLLSATASGAGSTTLPLTIPAGSTSVTYYAQGLQSSGTVTHSASAPGFTTVSATTPLAPSGVILVGPFGFGASFFTTSLSGGPQPVTVYLDVLNPSAASCSPQPASCATGTTQALRGGLAPVQVFLTSSNTNGGTVSSPVTIVAGSDNGVAQFTPKNQGATTLSLVTPVPGLTTSTTQTSLTATVTTP